MTCASPTRETIEAAIGMAVRAPSVHNTQPWRFRIRDDVIELWADQRRRLPSTDPQRAKLVVSCGAALHHLRVALAVLGWSATVEQLPDPAQDDHLATIELCPQEPKQHDFDLSAALLHRHSDRRGYVSWEVPPGYLRTVASSAARFGAVVRHVPEGLRARLVRPFRDAVDCHADDPRYQHELAEWSGRRGTADGVPAANAPRPHPQDPIPARAFAEPELLDRMETPDAAEWLVVCTAADDRLSQLRAGEATSALLLTATDLGLSTCLQTEPLGIPELREDIRAQVLYDCAYPQAMVRLGWVPSTAAPLPHTPRRAVAEVIDD